MPQKRKSKHLESDKEPKAVTEMRREAKGKKLRKNKI